VPLERLPERRRTQRLGHSILGRAARSLRTTPCLRAISHGIDGLAKGADHKGVGAGKEHGSERGHDVRLREPLRTELSDLGIEPCVGNRGLQQAARRERIAVGIGSRKQRRRRKKFCERTERPIGCVLHGHQFNDLG